MKTIPKPAYQKIETSMGSIHVFRNPFTKAWLFNVTIAHKTPCDALNIRFRPITALAKLAYITLLIILPLAMLTACGPTSAESTQETVTATHPKACIEAYPVVPDTIIKSLEKWPLKVGNGPRNRCSFDSAEEWVECSGKGDTLYTIDTYCPATLKAKAELGGN